MPVGPYSQDVLTGIYNVHFGGGIFVYGTLLDNALYCVKAGLSGSELDQRTIPAPGPGTAEFGLSARGSCYGVVVRNEGGPSETRTPVFLLCGNKASKISMDDGAGNQIEMMVLHTLIYYSNDGLRWDVVRQQDGTPTLAQPSPGANPAALVWDKDKNAFFYDQNNNLNDQIFQSANGESWANVSSTSTKDVDPSTYTSKFLPHCADNDCTDDFGQHVPDGVMSTPGSVTAKPVRPPSISYVNGASTIGSLTGEPPETPGAAEIMITVETTDSHGTPIISTKIVSVPGVPKVFCVAVVNGVIMAGGSADKTSDSGAVAISFDLGVTWKAVARRASCVTTMIANARL
jgi:hypothetical protein